jgi:hypothetical protein
MVSRDDVLHRFIGDALHFRHDILVVLIELVVDEDHAFIGDVDRDVAAVALDLVQVVFDLVQSQLRRRFGLGLGVSDPAAGEEKSARGKSCDESPTHRTSLYQICRWASAGIK